MREALIKAGLRAVAEDGPDGFSLRGVASYAGVTAPAVYRHFKDKDELLAAIAADSIERLAAAVTEAVAKAPQHPLERFRAEGVATLQFAVAHPAHYRAMTVPGLIAKLPESHRRVFDAYLVQQRRELEEAQRTDQIASIPIDDLLLAAHSLIYGLAHLIVEGQLGEVDAERAKQLAFSVTAAIGVGFIPRDAPAKPTPKPKAARKVRRG